MSVIAVPDLVVQYLQMNVRVLSVAEMSVRVRTPEREILVLPRKHFEMSALPVYDKEAPPLPRYTYPSTGRMEREMSVGNSRFYAELQQKTCVSCDQPFWTLDRYKKKCKKDCRRERNDNHYVSRQAVCEYRLCKSEFITKYPAHRYCKRICRKKEYDSVCKDERMAKKAADNAAALSQPAPSALAYGTTNTELAGSCLENA